MGYQFFLPMVLRWRASRAEAPLLTTQLDKEENIFSIFKSVNYIVKTFILIRNIFYSFSNQFFANFLDAPSTDH